MKASRVRIALFGQPRVAAEDGSREFPLQRKSLNVLAYLILNNKRPPTRDAVAFALFPDEDEEKARGSLRRNLSFLLSSLPATDGAEPFVLASAERLAWNPAAPAYIDVLAFERALDEGRDDDALAEYAGLLLPTIYDDWTTAPRERLREAANEALARTIARDRSLRHYDAAIASARRLLEDDPWREDIVRQVMSVRYEAGDRAGALAAFAHFASRMREEMDAEPMAETLALREAILRGARLATSEASKQKNSAVSAALPFVGRDDALSQAIERWHMSADGRAGAFFLAGEAGIGKSRFTAELARAIEREGGATIIGETAAGGERRPYEAVIEALRYAPPIRANERERRGPAWRTLVDELLDENAHATLGDDRSARVRLFDTIRKALVELARARPLAVILEDLHWAGPATIELIGYLIERLGTTPVLLVGTYRDDELTRLHPLRELVRNAERAGRAVRVALGRLAGSDAARVARMAAPADISNAAVEAAVTWSEGVPLLLSEAVRDLRAGRGLSTGGFQEVLARRFAQLAPDPATALSYAAVLGARFELETVAAAIGWRDDQLVDALAPSMELGLIRAEAPSRGLTFAFSHHVVHAAALGRIAQPDLGRAHLLVARALRTLSPGGDRALEVAQHYAAAGDARHAAEQYAVGARHALDVFANADAREAATSGLRFVRATEDDRELCYDLLATRERALTRLGVTAERRADAERMCELAGGDERRLCGALERLIEATRGDESAQRAAFSRLEELGRTSERALASFEKKVGEEALNDGNFQTAAAAGARAAQHFARLGDADATLQAQLTRVNGLSILGESGQAIEVISSLRLIVANCDDLWLQTQFYNTSAMIGIDGAHEGALADAEHALELAVRIGDRFSEAFARHNIGWMAGIMGESARSVTEYERAIEIYSHIDYVSGAVTTMFNLAGIRYWCGDYDGALRLFEELDGLDAGQPWFGVQADAHRGALWLRAGDLEAAERYLLRAREKATQQGLIRYLAHIHSFLAEIEARRGNFPQACAELEAAKTALEQLGWAAAGAQTQALAARVFAEMHDEAAAQAASAAARATAAVTSSTEIEPKFWWDLAAASLVLGDATAALELAAEGARVFCDHALRMRPDLAESYGTLPWHLAIFALLQGREVPFRLVG